MGDKTAIEWTDATINFWWGCTKVGPGCDNCYAQTFSDRFNKPSLWGVGADRKFMPNAAKALSKLKSGRVFIQSMSDIGDSEVPLEWFKLAWEAIKANPQVQVQLVTKRLPVLLRRLVAIGETKWPGHVGLMVTVVNQVETDRDIPKLIAAKRAWSIPWIGLSCEPLLGDIDLVRFTPDFDTYVRELDWVVCGGESGPDARPMHPDWARSLRDQCVDAGVPFFFKQWGQWVPSTMITPSHPRFGSTMNGRDWYQGGWIDCAENEGFAPDGCTDDDRMYRIGKAAAGDLLDGVQHHNWPITQ